MQLSSTGDWVWVILEAGWVVEDHQKRLTFHEPRPKGLAKLLQRDWQAVLTLQLHCVRMFV
jgi:hypothetical protein